MEASGSLGRGDARNSLGMLGTFYDWLLGGGDRMTGASSNTEVCLGVSVGCGNTVR